MPKSGHGAVEISVQTAYRGQVSSAWLRKLASKVLDEALDGSAGPAFQLSLAVADDDTVQRLNREYRGLDEVTDVLAFSPVHSGHWEGDGEPPPGAHEEIVFPAAPENPVHLGDVVISYPQVVRQAGPGPSGVEAELAQLVTHGVLHLLGFDHAESQEKAVMRARERELVSSALSQG